MKCRAASRRIKTMGMESWEAGHPINSSEIPDNIPDSELTPDQLAQRLLQKEAGKIPPEQREAADKKLDERTESGSGRRDLETEKRVD